MTLNIDTKFNIGDTVYSPECYEVYWANNRPYVITDIFIKIAHNRTSITYRIIQDQLTDVVSENFLFSTYEECKQWCGEQNKEDTI